MQPGRHRFPEYESIIFAGQTVSGDVFDAQEPFKSYHFSRRT